MLLLETKRTLVHVGALVEKIIGLVKPTARCKKIKIILISDPSLPRTIAIDSVRLFRILLELITNAMKYTKRGTVTIQLAAQFQSHTDRTILQCSVHDTGIGIPKDQKTAIFNRQYRISQDTHGAGLGLSIVKKLLKEINGEIQVESQVGVGSTFTCLIPFANNIYDSGSDLPLLSALIQQDKKNIKNALLKKDWQQLADTNHRLLGAVIYCNIPKLESACRRLQIVLRRSISDRTHITDIQKSATVVLQEIKKLSPINGL